MVIVSIEENAGLGNQLFQYAHGYALAKKYGHALKVVSYLGRADNIRTYMLDQLTLDKDIVKSVCRVDIMNIFRGKHFKGANALNRIYRRLIQKRYDRLCTTGKIIKRSMQKDQNRTYIPDAPLNSDKDYYIEGFYECYRYFIEYADDIRKQLKVNPDRIDIDTRRWQKQIQCCNSVALHIRMGDFATCNRLFPISFYENAYRHLNNILEDPVFYIFSEDDFVKNYFEEKHEKNIKIVSLNCDNKDMMEWHLLSCCHHHVITNSTYSWWSAFAADYSDKRVFIPTEEEYLQRENADIYRGEVPYGIEHYKEYFLPKYEVLNYEG